ncbi:MFS transporter, AAHS family, benzoate transport protein [Saccharopolyspora kobensis]|uniref:MFS transporter, AAHS family, benzoate transport protein n=1 Tax=Saccharopolyspora kobensis TaxID=146035 RepID=A0A1H6APY2_9PSEU|nr:aromatic acid/H+ symport family MFS transporter [Saccharopolyspora kobensis]SEG50591.1 MFS transporter, AAHS family, benzoate transport protein [Saccharopolyspora kobensis]SFE76220.1 MFS transporter, AAHS family, benzoate transport protein [Saccharopolyspora kobensis]
MSQIREHATEPSRKAALVVGLCWLAVVFDGYDLIVYGAVLPELLREPGWALTAGSAGLLGSLAFAGMLVGALVAGALSDRIGRRRAVLLCTVWFSVCTVLCGFAWNPGSFGVLRLLAGLGLGGLVPSVSALAAEFVAPHRRSLVSTLMMSGVPIGGSAASVLGIWLIPNWGWRSMFGVGAAGVLVAVLCRRLVPETAAHHRARGDHERAAAVEREFGVVAEDSAAQPPTGGLFARAHLRATALFALSTLTVLFAWFGLGTWLPQLMRQSGFDLGSALTFLLALNLGAVAGSLLTAWAGDRFGPVRVGAVAAVVAALALAGLIAHPPNAITYGLLVLAGVGTHGTQCLIIAGVANHYPARLRGTALGWALGVGRIGAVAAPQVGGLLLAAGLGVGANFLAFAVAAAVAGALLWACPRPVATA